MIEVKQGDCIEVLARLPENSIDACVTDPPYGLGQVKDIAGLLAEWMADRDGDDHVGGSGFMQRKWDRSVPSPRMWRELYRVIKPGAYALVFAGSRTCDLMGIALRLAGFEVVDQIFWTFGGGFPKGADVGKMLDKQAGVEREVVGTRRTYYPDTARPGVKCEGRDTSNLRCHGHGLGKSPPDNKRPVTAPPPKPPANGMDTAHS